MTIPSVRGQGRFHSAHFSLVTFGSTDLSICSVALFLFLHFLNNAAAQYNAQRQATPITPAWSADVRGILEDPPVRTVVGARGHEYEHAPKTSLWFVDDNTVVATFVIRKGGDNPKLSQRDTSDQQLALRLRAVFFDAISGKVKATQDWPVTSRSAHIVAVHDGRFVTQSANILTLYSSGLAELKKLQLPPAEEDHWIAQPSPTGKTILFIATDLRTRSAVPWIWVETDSLQVVKSWQQIQSGWVGISDDSLAMTSCVWFYDCQPDVEIKRPDVEWKTVSTADRHFEPHPQFVDNELLVLLGSKLVALRPNGEVVRNEITPFEGCWWGGVYPAAQGQRFVIPSCKAKGGSTLLDLGGREELTKIFVYDVPFQGQPKVLDLGGTNVKAASLIALSPDGSKLAALSNIHIVSVYCLPSPAH
jgi:hypothetical protein